MSHCPLGFFRAIRNKYWNKHNVNEHNMAKNFNWQEVDQLASYKCDQGVELGTTKNDTSCWSEWHLSLQPPDFNYGTLTTQSTTAP